MLETAFPLVTHLSTSIEHLESASPSTSLTGPVFLFAPYQLQRNRKT